MLRLNFQVLDEGELDKKKSLLQSIFSVNYDKMNTSKINDLIEPYSPGFRNLINGNECSKPLGRQKSRSDVYDSNKSAVKAARRLSNFNVSNNDSRNHNSGKHNIFENLVDYSNSGTGGNQLPNKSFEKSFNYIKKCDNPQNDVIKSIKYVAKADRMIAMKKRILNKHTLMRTHLQNSDQFILNKDIDEQNEQINKSLSYIEKNRNYDKFSDGGTDFGIIGLPTTKNSSNFKKYKYLLTFIKTLLVTSKLEI
jgi:hypothetical protein